MSRRFATGMSNLLGARVPHIVCIGGVSGRNHFSYKEELSQVRILPDAPYTRRPAARTDPRLGSDLSSSLSGYTISRASYRGQYAILPSWTREFESLRPLHLSPVNGLLLGISGAILLISSRPRQGSDVGPLSSGSTKH